jgi:hypothetical protein
MELAQVAADPLLKCALKESVPAGMASEEPVFQPPRRAPWTFGADLVFLVGSPRSGTTWLQSLIAHHPEIYTGPETQFFGAYHPVEKEYLRVKDGRCGISEYLRPTQFYGLMAESFWTVVSALPEPPAAPRYFLEKSPYHCVFGELILRTFPKARFIHLIRDARAVVASMLRISKSWGESWAPSTAERATEFWFECVQAGCGISQIVSSPDHYLGIRYEDVRADPTGYLAWLYHWLGLPCDEALIQEALAANTLDPGRSGRELFPSIVMPQPDSPQPKFPDDFVGPAPSSADQVDLTPEDRRTVERMAVDVLRELGYPVALDA